MTAEVHIVTGKPDFEFIFIFQYSREREIKNIIKKIDTNRQSSFLRLK
jgi:hypothetical protein